MFGRGVAIKHFLGPSHFWQKVTFGVLNVLEVSPKETVFFGDFPKGSHQKNWKS